MINPNYNTHDYKLACVKEDPYIHGINKENSQFSLIYNSEFIYSNSRILAIVSGICDYQYYYGYHIKCLEQRVQRKEPKDRNAREFRLREVGEKPCV